MGLMFAAACWGFAEATLFFIVPDVLLTAIAIRNRRAALWCCAYAALGALAGGALMYAWGSSSPEDALRAVDAVPAVNAAEIATAEEGLARHGVLGMLVGAFTGTPFKAYAVQAAEAGIPLATFLAATVPARLPRFVVVTLVASAAARVLAPRVGMRVTYLLWLAVWLAVYVTYFLAHRAA